MQSKMTFYFDYNATTPLLPRALDAMLPYFSEEFANPASLHAPGRRAARAIRKAREECACFIKAEDSREVVFTSGATEGNNAVLQSAVRVTGKRKIITSSVEHSSVLRVCQMLEMRGVEIVRIPVDREGQWDEEALKKQLSADVALVSLMSANNETGIRFPLERVAPLIKQAGILLHVDAVQSAGKEPLDVSLWQVDFLTLSGHKFYGPKGVGVLYVKQGIPFEPFLAGGSHEAGRRAGTLYVPGIVGLGAACEEAGAGLEAERFRLLQIRDDFEKRLSLALEEIMIHGSRVERLVNTSSVFFGGVSAEALLLALDQEGIYASSGSACASGANEPSHVLRAMGVSEKEALGTVRFSFGRGTRLEDIPEAVGRIQRTVARLRKVEK